jgi:adhesin transport system outer membrane protein
MSDISKTVDAFKSPENAKILRKKRLKLAILACFLVTADVMGMDFSTGDMVLNQNYQSPIAGKSGLELRISDICETCARFTSLPHLAAKSKALLKSYSVSDPVVVGPSAMTNRATYGLAQLVDLSISNHPNVAAKLADLGAAQSEVDAARQAFYPAPAAQLQQGRDSSSVVSLQIPLWTGGRLTAGLNAAGSRVRSSDIAIIEAQYALALRVTNAYQAWLQANGRLVVLNRSIRQLGSFLNRIVRRITAGTSAEVDRELVAARLAHAQSDFAVVHTAERDALAHLSQVVGQTLTSDDLSGLQPNSGDDNLPRLKDLTDESLSRNPSLRRIEYDIKAAQYDTEGRRAVSWPTVSVRAEHQRSVPVAGAGVTNDNRVFLMFEYTPGAGISAASQADASSNRTQSLRESRESARRDLSERVAIEYGDYASTLSRKQDLQRTLRLNKEALSSYERFFATGKRSWLDVLNAARELTQVELIIADIDPQLVGGRYRLRLLSGDEPWLQRQPGINAAEMSVWGFAP